MEHKEMEYYYKHLPILRLAATHAARCVSELTEQSPQEAKGNASNALSCALDADACARRGAIWHAEQRALKSLSYSCGVHSRTFRIASEWFEHRYTARPGHMTSGARRYDFDLTVEDMYIRIRMLNGSQSGAWFMYADAYSGDYNIIMALIEARVVEDDYTDVRYALFDFVNYHAQEADDWYERDEHNSPGSFA